MPLLVVYFEFHDYAFFGRNHGMDSCTSRFRNACVLQPLKTSQLALPHPVYNYMYITCVFFSAF